jgi:flagellar hook-basal body complex protein FliE
MEYIANILVREAKKIAIKMAIEAVNINRAFAQKIKDGISDWLTGDDELEQKAKTKGEGIGGDFGSGTEEGIYSSTGYVSKAASEMGKTAVDSLKKSIDSNSPSEKTKDEGKNFGLGFGNGINNMTPWASFKAQKMGEDSAAALNKGWGNSVFNPNKQIEPKKEGILSGLFGKLSDSFKESAKVITKPVDDMTKKMGDDINKNLGKNLQNGLKKSGASAAKSAKEVKSAFDISMEWIDERKYYGELTLAQELAEFTRLQSLYKKGSEERKKIDREIYRVKKEIINSEDELNRKSYKHSKDWISDRKYYNELTLEEELAAWVRVNGRYQSHTEEYKETAKEIYRVKKALLDREENDLEKQFNNSKKWIQEQTDYDLDNMRIRLESKKRVLAREQKLVDENQGKEHDRYKEIKLDVYKDTKAIANKEKELIREVSDLKIQRLKDIAAVEKDNADKVKDINEKLKQDIQSVNDEYENALKSRTQAIYGSFGLFEKLEEEKNRTKDILKLKEELVGVEKKIVEYKNDKTGRDVTVEKSTLETQIQGKKEELIAIQKIQKANRQGTPLRVEADMQAKLIGNELAGMLEKLEGLEAIKVKYDEITAKRIDSEKEVTRIQEELKSKELVSGSELIQNLKDQVSELQIWRQNIADLKAKGIDKELLGELQDMGPKSLNELKALNALSAPELQQYSTLWLVKYRLARTQAETELKQMKIDSVSKIEELRTESAKALDGVKSDTKLKLTELKKETTSKLVEIKDVWTENLGNIRTEARTQFLGIVTDIKKDLKSSDFKLMGNNVGKGFANGIGTSKKEVKQQTVMLGEAPLEAIAEVLHMKSPSRKMFDLGVYAGQGFANGIKSLTSSIVDESYNIGNSSMQALKQIITGIADFLNGNMDLNPSIVPVLDLGNVRNGVRQLNGMFGGSSMRLASNTNTASQQSVLNSIIPLLGNQNGSEIQPVNNTFDIASIVVREEADIKRIARELYQLQIVRNRG